ncbi:hypothetical protein PV326_005623 [Microctonus aethiopoides]|uniref:ZP domain-containing protein n=2 Tax=Microctonus aethiopoides TaxID=144406 RepID=A0AA39FPY1_9HYME|nr:hypothetical protein PV326_005623 [Microctonus aethiopoides]KAK0173371.1 hypothetical protein PV328_006581 [Microctonus aethiopoides]
MQIKGMMLQRIRHWIIISTLIIIGIIIVHGEDCVDTGWEKVEGVMPENYTRGNVLYSGSNSDGIVNICFDRCLKVNCSGFYIDFGRSTCVNVEIISNEFEPVLNFIFFHKICIKVPAECNNNKLWQVQRTLGAILIDTTVTPLPGLLTRSQCYQRCIEEGMNCKSAQFRTSVPFSIGDVEGRCSLLQIERGIRPQSYRASMYRDEYLETQCHKLSNTDYCSYAEFRNMTLPYSDLKVIGLNEKQCEERCGNSRDGFICRGFTVDYTMRNVSNKNSSICLLHSEDTISAGVSSLMNTANVVYKEREPCLNLKVSCGNTSLTIQLETTEPFNGRVYASGYSETCDVQGTGLNRTILQLRIPDKNEITQGNIECGIIPAFAVDSNNETRIAVWVTVIVQFNPIIQRLGDQAVRVGCTLDDNEVPLPRNITIGSSFNFISPDAGIPPVVGTVFNTTDSPMVTMRILDEESREITSADLGQRLLLKIGIIPSNGPYDIAAGHLVASSTSGDSSILLLDEMGCPTDSKIFPAMYKDPVDNRSLISTFTAFKFPDSYRVKFNVIVKFCLTECQSVQCRTGVLSFGKQKRSLAMVKPIDTNFDSTNTTLNELPLEWSIIVRDDAIAADSLRAAKSPDTILIAGEQSVEGLLCVDAALAMGLLILWLIVQIILTATCIYVIRRYRRVARKAEEDRADVLTRHLYGIHGGNFEISRRVRWADHNGSSIS